MKVIVLSDQPQLCQALTQHFAQRNRPCQLLDWSLLEQLPALSKQLQSNPGATVLVAPSSQANGNWQSWTQTLAAACRASYSSSLFLSSAAVFSGDKQRYSEQDTANSESDWYLAEQALLAADTATVIIRSSALFSAADGNVLSTLLQSMQRGGELAFNNRFRSAPTAAADLARVVSAVIDQLSCGAELAGVYHYTASEAISHYQFAEAVYAVASQYLDTDKLAISIQPEDTVDPAWSLPLLKCDKIRNTFGIKQLPWRSFISDAVSHYFNRQGVSDE